jgi:hypothetical protein
MVHSIFQENSQELVRAIFSHPNGVNIPAVGVNSLAFALGYAIEENKPEIVSLILSHPNAIKIPIAELEVSLKKAKAQGQQKIVDMISAFKESNQNAEAEYI